MWNTAASKAPQPCSCRLLCRFNATAPVLLQPRPASNVHAPQGQNLLGQASYPRHKNVHDVEVGQFADVEDVIVLGTANVCPEIALGLGAERLQHLQIHRVPHHQNANGLLLLLEAGQCTALAGGACGTPHKGARRFVLPAAYEEICCWADRSSHCLEACRRDRQVPACRDRGFSTGGVLVRLLASPAPASTRVVTAILHVPECMVDRAICRQSVSGKLNAPITN